MNEICITILKNVDGKVDVGISAPKSMAVHRLEIFEKNKAREIKD
nr:carbon storage regulator [Legionella quinlivanii]